jgi:hypothetical protein
MTIDDLIAIKKDILFEYEEAKVEFAAAVFRMKVEGKRLGEFGELMSKLALDMEDAEFDAVQDTISGDRFKSLSGEQVQSVVALYNAALTRWIAAQKAKKSVGY